MRYIDAEPPRVAIIFEKALRIKASTPEIESALSEAGYSTLANEHGLTVEFERDTFIGLAHRLSALRIAFSLDHRQAISPADRVTALVEAEVEIDAPTACSFDGTRWLLHNYPWEQRISDP